MNYILFGRELRKLRKEFNMNSNYMSKDLKEKGIIISSSRILQIEKSIDVIKTEKKLNSYIDLFSSYFETKYFEKDIKKTKEDISKILKESLKSDINLTKEEIDDYLDKIFNYFTTKTDNKFSNGYENLIGYIKNNYPNFFYDEASKIVLRGYLGLYEYYEYDLKDNLITKRYLRIYESDNGHIKLRKTCSPPLDNYEYDDSLSTIRKRDDVIYIDLEEKSKIERFRICFSHPFGFKSSGILTGISLELNKIKEPMARYVLLVKLNNISDEGSYISQKEKEPIKKYSEKEFLKIYSDSEYMLYFLKSIKNYKLIAQPFSSYIYEKSEKYFRYFGFTISTSSENCRISISSYSFKEKYIQDKKTTSVEIAIPDKYTIKGHILHETNELTVIQAKNTIINIQNVPEHPEQLKNEHTVLSGVVNFFSESRVFFSSKTILLRTNIDFETMKEYSTRVNFEKLPEFINKIYDSISFVNNKNTKEESIKKISNNILEYLGCIDTSLKNNSNNKTNSILQILNFSQSDILRGIIKR